RSARGGSRPGSASACRCSSIRLTAAAPSRADPAMRRRSTVWCTLVRRAAYAPGNLPKLRSPARTPMILRRALFDRDALGEIAGLIDVGAAQNGHVEGEQLQWHRVNDGRLEVADVLGHMDDLHAVA